MNNPASILFSHVAEEDIYKKYIDDLKGFQSQRKANSAAYSHLCTLLDASAKDELDLLLEGESYMESIQEEAAFTAGLALGLQLLRLL